MTATEYRTHDKADWGPGPWQDEPDKISWTDEATGLPCLIVRNHGGALCGYAGVNPDHPWHGLGYDDIDLAVGVHGGLTYSAGCGHGDEATSICHIPEPGQPDDVWWFGFDCAHSGDVSPSWRSPQVGLVYTDHDTYRDVDYVRGEVRSLAAQLKEMMP